MSLQGSICWTGNDDESHGDAKSVLMPVQIPQMHEHVAAARSTVKGFHCWTSADCAAWILWTSLCRASTAGVAMMMRHTTAATSLAALESSQSLPTSFQVHVVTAARGVATCKCKFSSGSKAKEVVPARYKGHSSA
jgi:hypothetical protein